MRYYIMDGQTGEILSPVFEAANGKKALERFLAVNCMFRSNYEIYKSDKCRYHTIAKCKYGNAIFQANEW